jgi:N-acetyl-alpha-D-glucosaminyl L-malate synthase BshA
MRIGIACYPTVGGSGAVATALARQLAARHHTVHLFSYRLPLGLGELNGDVTFHTVDPASYGVFEHPPQDLALAAKMAEVATESGIDLFHVHYAIPHAVAGFLAREMLGPSGPRLITTLHGTDVTLVGEDRSFAAITRFGIERSDGVTAVSEFLRRQTEEQLGIRRSIEVIPNFVDVSRCCPSRARADPGAFAEPGEKILLHCSNFRPSRRVLDAVRVLERVNRELPVRLLMIGDGPERAAAHALARRLGVTERVRFLGQHEATAEITAMSHVFLIPSELESFGLPALEAMACAVPVIGTDAGGLPELVLHGETGYLLPVGDTEQMASRALEILQDEERRREMGQAGRRRAAALFGVDRIVSRYEEYYQRVLSA